MLRAASGADPTTVFNGVQPPSELLETVEWLPDAERDGRTMEPDARRMVTDAYVRALSALDRAGRGDEAAPLAAYLSGPALDRALEQTDDDRSVVSSTEYLSQQLRLEYYSDDGAVIAVTVPEVEIVRIIQGDGTDTRQVLWSDESWRFVMMLQDGNWRIQQLEITAVRTGEPSPERRPLTRALDGVNTVTVNSVDPSWASYDDAMGASELDAVADLGLDSVRVFIAGPDGPPIDVDAIQRFLDLAADRGIAVVLTLFDGAGDHSIAGWRDDRDHLAEVVGALAGHEAIAMWDLKNEPDLDDGRSGGSEIVDAWLDRVADDVRTLDPTTPITVGWSSGDEAHRALGALDVVSFHHFGDATTLDTAIRRLRSDIGPRPLVVSEFGRPAWIGFVRGSQPADQARRMSELAEVIERNAVDGSMVWLLRDPDRPIEEGLIAGRASASYGLFRADGTERPVADVVRTDGRTGLPKPSVLEQLRSWPVLVLASPFVGLLGGVTLVRRVRAARSRRLIRT